MITPWMQNDFVLDQRLARDSIPLGELEISKLLLMNNALVPWFILVPRVSEIEFYRLSGIQQLQLLGEINLLSNFIEREFQPDKLNLASIGNVVTQLHIHIIARKRNDYCWPQAVWGREERQPYTSSQLERLMQRLRSGLPGQFTRQFSH